MLSTTTKIKINLSKKNDDAKIETKTFSGHDNQVKLSLMMNNITCKRNRLIKKKKNKFLKKLTTENFKCRSKST